MRSSAIWSSARAIGRLLAVPVGRRGRPARIDAALRKVPRALARDLEAGLQRPVRVRDSRVTRTGTLVCLVEVGSDAYIAKAPLRSSTTLRLQRHAAAITRLTGAPWLDRSLGDLIPRPVHAGAVGGLPYFVETCVAGTNAVTWLGPGRDSRSAIDQAVGFLIAFQEASRQGDMLSSHVWQRSVQPMLERVGLVASRAGQGAAYRSLTEALRRQLLYQPLPTVFCQGNFWLGNVLLDAGGAVTGVIDWDCAAEEGLPLLDVFYLLVRTDSLVRRVSYGEAFAGWLRAPEAWHAGAARRYCDALSVPDAAVEPLALLSWVQHIDTHCMYSTPALARPEWVERNVTGVIRAVHRRAAGSTSRRWSV